jgi:ElaB/YqjD/DUF883 family membrane-anchored ribosome-binding protein
MPIMAVTDNIESTTQDAREQLRQLRAQVEQLMSERVSPALANAAERAENAAYKARDFTGQQAEVVSERVRERPLASILIAAGVGYLLGRITR